VILTVNYIYVCMYVYIFIYSGGVRGDAGHGLGAHNTAGRYDA